MARIFHPKIVTANDLLEGHVIYRRSDGSWSPKHSEAEVFNDAEAADAALEEAILDADEIVGAYLADARLNESGFPEPVHFREAFRTRGPSNYPNHGKQAEL